MSASDTATDTDICLTSRSLCRHSSRECHLMNYDDNDDDDDDDDNDDE